MTGLHKRILALAALAALLAAALFFPEQVHQAAGGVFRDAVAPFLSMVNDARSAVVMLLGGTAAVFQENTEMAREMGVMSNELRALRIQALENAELREQSGFARRSPLEFIPCEAVARDLAGWWRTVRVDKGALHGARVNLPVVSSDGLAGKITTVSGHTAEVLLISDPAWKASARLAGKPGSFGVISGAAAPPGETPVLRLTFVDKNIPVLHGDEVETSGLGPGYPPGLIIGRVKNVFMDSSGLFQHADVTPAAAVNDLKFLYIVRMPDADGH